MSVESLTNAAPDGGMGETKVSPADVTSPARRRLIAAGAALGAASLFLGKTPLGPSPGHADLVRSVKGILHLDPIVVNFAFELEELQKEFFTNATLSNAYRSLPSREQNVFNLIAKEDMEHFEAIADLRARKGAKNAGSSETPGSTSTLRPRIFNFPGKAFESRTDLYATALDIKETSLFAYHGAVDLVRKDTLMLAAAIAGVEGRHVALLREMNGQDPIPSPFETAMGAQAAGRHLERYGFTGGGHHVVSNQ